MNDVAHILGEFIAAWNAGDRPRLGAYLERVPEGDRDELAEQIQTFLMIAPEPEYDEATWSQMTAAPMIARAAAEAMEPEPWPQLLPRLRERARLSLPDVVERLGIGGAGREKAERLLGEMESGSLDPLRPSRSLLERLAGIFGVSPEALDWRGGGPQPAAAAPALYRMTGEPTPEGRLGVLADALVADADAWDEVDELFLGGRQ